MSATFGAVIDNPIMKRKQLCLKVFHNGKAAPSAKEMKAFIADKYKVKDQSTIFLKDCHTSFGGCFTMAHVCIYESKEAAMKFETSYRLIRAGLMEAPKVTPRKAIKTQKNKLKEKRCAEKGALTMANRAKQ